MWTAPYQRVIVSYTFKCTVRRIDLEMNGRHGPRNVLLKEDSLATASDEHLSAYNKKFRIMLAIMAAPDGRQWGPSKMSRATSGAIGTSYFNALRDGHVHIPKADKMQAVAAAMGFPPQLWFKDLQWWQHTYNRWEAGDDLSTLLTQDQDSISVQARISRLLNTLIQLKPHHDTGKPLSDEDIASLSEGVLDSDRIANLRNGAFTVVEKDELAALCKVFKVSPAYWKEESAVPWKMSPSSLSDLMDVDSYETMQNSLNLSQENRGMLKRMSEYLKATQNDERQTDS